MKLIERLKQSFHNMEWSERIRQMWLPIIFAVGFSLTLCVNVHHSLSDAILEPTLFFFGAGYLLFGMLQLTDAALILGKNEGIRTAKAIAIQLLAFAALLLDTIWWATDDKWSLAVRIGHGAVYAALFACIFLIPTLRQKDDRHLMRFTTETLVTGILLGLSVGIATGALEGLLQGIQTLFNLDRSIMGKIGEDLAFLMMGAVFGSLLVMILPKANQEGFATAFTQKLCNIAGKYILLPVLLLYMLVLYIYIIKIVAIWELPNGTVTWMTTVMMVALLLTVFLLYPSLYTEEPKKIWRIMRRALPLMAIPPLVLMTIGLIRRVSDYGWTVDRIYAVALNCWCYLACGLVALASWREKKIITQLALSFFALLLLLSVIPGMNVAQYTQRLLTRQVASLISKADVPFPVEACTGSEMSKWLEGLSDEQAEPIYSKLNYLDNTFGRESVSRWLTDGGNRWFHWSATNKGQSGRGEIFTFGRWDDDEKQIEIPEGYTKVQILGSFEAEEEADGKLTLTFKNPDFSVTFDPATVGNGPVISLPTTDGRLLVLTYLKIVEYGRPNYLNENGSGYLFSK